MNDEMTPGRDIIGMVIINYYVPNAPFPPIRLQGNFSACQPHLELNGITASQFRLGSWGGIGNQRKSEKVKLMWLSRKRFPKCILLDGVLSDLREGSSALSNWRNSMS